MKPTWIAALVLTLLCAGPFIAIAQDDASSDTSSAVLPNTAAQAYIWTNKLGYATGEQMRVRLTMNAMGDTNTYTMFFYRENIETGEREYFAAFATDNLTLHDSIVDASGNAAGAFQATAITTRSQSLIWRGNVPTPGVWHFVGELRSADTTQVAKKIFAKFVVSRNTAVTLGGDGTDTEISEDTTWTNDTIYRIRYQVFVNTGATLTIEPGTLILASGQNAVIVVEKGGKIVADGRREAPIVMTCDAAVGERFSGCWAGLIVLGDAPMTRGTGRAEGVLPEDRPVYGGTNAEDSSGVLRYVRVEFAGVDFNPETQPNAFGFHGVGAGTVIEHIQAHEGEDDGIEFFGGTADCLYCVSDGSKDDSLDWAFGWRGTAQHVFILQDGEGDNGIEADNDKEGGFNREPRSHPTLYNLTMIGGALQSFTHGGDGMRIRVGTAITARNVILTGFGGDALDVRDNSPSFFMDGTSSIESAIIAGNGGTVGDAQIQGGVASNVDYDDVAPMLTNVRLEGNPDPRPMLGSPASMVGAAAVPPSDGTLNTSAQCIGAFCGENWLEEWTFFGDEGDYDVVSTTTSP